MMISLFPSPTLRETGTIPPDVTVTGGSASFTTPTNPYTPDGSVWSYNYISGVLDSTGAKAGMLVILPDCIGFKATIVTEQVAYYEGPFPLGVIQLNQNVLPASDSIPINIAVRWSSESLGFNILCDSQTFNHNTGMILNNPVPHYRFADHYNAGFGPGERPSNCGYFEGPSSFSTPVVLTPDGFNATLKSDPVDYQTSFPYKANAKLAQGSIEIQNNRIRGNNSSIDLASIAMAVNTSSCAPAPKTITAEFQVGGSFAEDGSLLVDGTLAAPVDPDFNTYNLNSVPSAVWYQPGFIVPTNAFKNGSDIAEYLQAMRSRTNTQLYSYGQAPFTQGTGLFAGLNFMPETFDGQPFQVTIDTSTIDLVSTIWTKLYLRKAGFTGVVDAESAGQTLSIYADPECGGDGYQVLLTSFGQAYLDNSSEGYDSTIDGIIDIPFPSAITIPFEDMNLNGCGNFTQGTVPADAKRKPKRSRTGRRISGFSPLLSACGKGR